MGCDMTIEQSERLSRIENNIDQITEKMSYSCSVLAKANGDIEKLDATLNGKVDNLHATLNGKVDNMYVTLNGKVDNLDTLMNGRLGVFEQRFAGLEEKLDRIFRNTSKKEDKKSSLYIAIFAAVIGGVVGALSRLL
jgi:uncharacterized ion transporter superfamily protein YfcC